LREFNFADEGDLDFLRKIIFADLSKTPKSAKFNSLKVVYKHKFQFKNIK